MKVMIHMCINTAGLAEVEIISPTDIKVELKNFMDNAAFYIDQNDGPKLGLQVQNLAALTTGEVIADALKQKLTEAVKQVAEDFTLQMMKEGGKA